MSAIVDEAADNAATPEALPAGKYKALPAGLSDRAKAILGGSFGLMGSKGSVTFQTPWNRSPEAIAAYDELLSGGYLSVTYGDKGRWALTYRAAVDCKEFHDWFRRNLKNPAVKFPIMVPDAQRNERPPRGWRPPSADLVEAGRVTR